MTAYSYLIDHAQKNVWCNPRMDNQLVFAPKRISRREGALNRFFMMDSEMVFPIQKRRFHVYVIGQLDPVLIGLLRQVPNWTTQRWFKFSDSVNANNMEITPYTANGVVLPRTQSFYMFLDERSLVFAFPEMPKFPVNYREEQIYVRLQSNAYYQLQHQTEKKLRCGGFRPTNNNEILAMEQALTQHRNTFAHLRIYLNGLMVDTARLGDVQIDDFVEWVGDDSVVRVKEWKLSDLHQFRSELDNTYKYLLHYEGDEPQRIEFQDDVDVYVVHRPAVGWERGVYYNRNYESHHRMITHRDYSVRTDHVEQLAHSLQEARDITHPPYDELYVQLLVRQGGYDRPLVFENQRIFELYKLSEEDRYRSLIGLDAVVPEWNCVNLEMSHYTELMRVFHKDIDIELVEKAYGYNACSVILGNTPQKTKLYSGRQRARLPYGLAKNSTVYEFDENGFLLGWHVHNNDDDYEARDDNCRLIEAVAGIGGKWTDHVEGQTDLQMPEMGVGYRVYRCWLEGGLPNHAWEDITGSDEYTIVNDRLIWNSPGNDHWLHIRTDKRFIAYDQDVEMNDGLLNFTVVEIPTAMPFGEDEPMRIPMAQIDIWMNGRSLIRGLDYYIQFPQVFVVNRLYLNQPVEESTQHFHVRLRSLPNSLMEFDPIDDRGWILHNTLSNNRRFDLRDDRVLQMNVGGRIVHRDDMTFGEDRPPPEILGNLNGQPYQIKDLIVPMWNFTYNTTDVMRAQSQEIDQRVSDYMTLKFGPMEPLDLAAIPQRYPTVSPFLSHILFLLRNNAISLPGDRLLTDNEVLAICQPHEGLLAYDPLNDTEGVDDRFQYIVPHANNAPYTLEFVQYRFYLAVVRLYSQGRVDFSEYVTMYQY